MPNYSEENRITVRYWPDSSSIFNHTGSWVSFGHVSLQTFVGGPNNEGHYISFWRADTDNRCCGKQEDHIHTREEDVDYCGQAHVDNTFTVYSLNAHTINAVYEDILPRLKWELRGSLYHQQDETAAVCSSLIYRLLVTGGLRIRQDERLLLGLPDTMKSSFFAGLAAIGPASSLLKNFLMHAGYGALRVNRSNGICEEHRFFHLGFKACLPSSFVKDIMHASPVKSFSFEKTPLFDELRIMVCDANKNMGPFWCKVFLTAIISAIVAAIWTSQRAATNYLFVKPADIRLLIEHLKAEEQRLNRAGISSFENLNVAQIPPDTQPESEHRVRL